MKTIISLELLKPKMQLLAEHQKERKETFIIHNTLSNSRNLALFQNYLGNHCPNF